MKKWSDNEKPDLDYWMFETKDDKGNNGIWGGMMTRNYYDSPSINFIITWHKI